MDESVYCMYLIVERNWKMLKRLSYIFLILVLVSINFGCATTPPTDEELANADYGTYISQEDAEEKAKIFLQTYLKNPSSARYKFKPVEKTFKQEGTDHYGSIRYGYFLYGKIKSKTRIGIYTGYKDYTFYFHNGELRAVYLEVQYYVYGEPGRFDTVLTRIDV